MDPQLLRSARVLGLSPVATFRKMVFPAAVPTIFTGIRISGAAAILVLIAAEMIGANAGLGYLINYSQQNFLIPQMYAGDHHHLGAGAGDQLRAGRDGAPLLALAAPDREATLMSMTRQMHLNAFLMGTGHHEAAWRLPTTTPELADVAHFQELARIAEGGKLDSVFFADSPLLWRRRARPAETSSRSPARRHRAATERIGLIATASTTFNEPYNLARPFASLDQIAAAGPAGTSSPPAARRRPGTSTSTSPRARGPLRAGAEFVDVVLGLWDSWEDDAVLADKERGVFVDPGGSPARAQGELQVRGPSTSPAARRDRRSSCRPARPAGIELAAAYAEAVFTAQTTLEDGQAFYAKLKAAPARRARPRKPQDPAGHRDGHRRHRGGGARISTASSTT